MLVRLRTLCGCERALELDARKPLPDHIYIPTTDKPDGPVRIFRHAGKNAVTHEFVEDPTISVGVVVR